MNAKASLKLIGPFSQILTMKGMPLKGMLKDEDLEVIHKGGILIEGTHIKEIGSFERLKKEFEHDLTSIELIEDAAVALPGFIDAHTHICFTGSRAKDYAARNNGKSYLEIAKEGGGIWSTVHHVREANQYDLINATSKRLDLLLSNGITTAEIKSGYGLTITQELKMLRVIDALAKRHTVDVIATCLAAHIIPKDWKHGEESYLQLILEELVPKIKISNYSTRRPISSGRESSCHRL